MLRGCSVSGDITAQKDQKVESSMLGVEFLFSVTTKSRNRRD